MSISETNNIASSSSSSNNLSLASSSWIPPRGFKFVPTDLDVCYYLQLFFQGNLPLDIPVYRVNIYDSTPEQLSNEYVKGNEKEWFFITERTRMSEGGKNLVRTDNSGGTWRGTQKAKQIEDENGVVVGNRTALEYHTVDNAKGDWLMLEYSSHLYGQNDKVDYALCKIYLTPKGSKRKAEETEDERKKKKKKKIVEVVKALQEELDQPLDDVALQPPQLESSQPQQQPPSDSHQQQPVMPNNAVSLAHYFYWDELVPKPREELDQPLDDVSLQPPQLESSQPQQHPPSHGYQVPLDSHQQQPVIPHDGVAHYLGERAPQLKEELDDVPFQPPQQHSLSDAYQTPLDLHQQPPVIPYDDEFEPQLLDLHGYREFTDEFEPKLLESDEYKEFMNCTGFLDDEFEDMINFQP